MNQEISPPYTPTPPDIKWLANELAATAGEMGRIDEEMVRLEKRRKQLKAMHHALAQVACLSGAPSLEELVPPVRAHGKYGGRGNLREWLKRLLQEAAPGAVDTRTIVRLAAQAFGLNFATEGESDRFRRNTLTRQLRWFIEQGLIDRVHDYRAAANSVGVWRWKGMPSRQEVLERARIAEAEPWP